MSITTTPQAAKAYALFDQPETVFTCQINQAFTTHDKTFTFAYDNATGSTANVKEGMTVLIGSTSGAYDKGITYVRKTPVAPNFYIGETSEIAFANNLYITVLEDWAVWSAYMFMSKNSTVYMKRDVVYADQHKKKKPVPIMGSDRVARYKGTAIAMSFNGASSYVYDSTISTYSWACSGASISGGSTATPTITFSAVRRYVVSLTITSAQGVSSVAYRIVNIWDSSSTNVAEVEIGSINGSYDVGGWSASFTVLSDATGIRPMSKAIIFSEEWYGGTEISYGTVTGSENIIMLGWVENETDSINIEGGSISFNLQGPDFWLEKTYNFTNFGISISAGYPTTWLEMQSLSPARALWHLIMWRTTLMFCVDVYLPTSTALATEVVAPAASLWEQIRQIGLNTLLAATCCDRYGRVFIEPEISLVTTTGRSGFPNRGSFSAADFESIGININRVTPTSQVLLSGITVSGTKGKPLFSLSRGHIPMRHGKPLRIANLVLETQALSNELCGNILEKENIPYSFSLQNLLYTNRLVDICPNQYITLSISANDNPRGISYSGNAIVKSIGINFSDGTWNTSWESIPETQNKLSVNGDIPKDPGDTPWVPPDFPPIVLPPVPPPPDPDPIPITPLGIVVVLLPGYGVWAMDTVDAFGKWYNVTSDFNWDPAELASINMMEVSPLGVAYLAGTGMKIWSQPVNYNTSFTVIEDGAYIGGIIGETGEISGLGFRVGTADGLVVVAGKEGSPLGGNKMATFALVGNSLENRYLNTTMFSNAWSGNLTNVDGKWYCSARMTDGWFAKMYRFTDDLTALDGAPNVYALGVIQTGYFHVAAYEADTLYTNKGDGRAPGILTASTFTPIGSPNSDSMAEYPNLLDCDPTGQYVIAAFNFYGSGDIRTSSDYGVTFSSVTNFPSMSYDGRAATSVKNGRVRYMNSAFCWLVTFNGTVYLDPDVPTVDYLHIFYTNDFGVTWQDWSGDIMSNGIIPQNITPRIIRNV